MISYSALGSFVFGAGLTLGSALLLGCQPSSSRGGVVATATTEGEHGHHEHARLVAPTLEQISDRFRALGDPGAAARIARVRLVGMLEFANGGARLPIEEVGVWPDRYELRLRGAGETAPVVSLTPAGLRLSLPVGWPGSFEPTEEFAELRMRSLFVLRHVAEALARGGTLVPTAFPTEGVAALDAVDSRGRFRVVWGGLTGRMLAVEDDSGRVYFPAFFQAGPWFLPSVQSFESNGVIEAVVRVTSVETVPRT